MKEKSLGPEGQKGRDLSSDFFGLSRQENSCSFCRSAKDRAKNEGADPRTQGKTFRERRVRVVFVLCLLRPLLCLCCFLLVLWAPKKGISSRRRCLCYWSLVHVSQSTLSLLEEKELAFSETVVPALEKIALLKPATLSMTAEAVRTCTEFCRLPGRDARRHCERPELRDEDVFLG